MTVRRWRRRAAALVATSPTAIIVLALAMVAAITLPAANAPAAYSGANGKIVFHSTRDGGDGDIFHMNADGTNQTQLTADSANDLAPTWSRDGSKILFTSNRDGDYEIFVMNADGSGQTQLTFNTASDGSPHFSPDRSDRAKIAFASDRDGNSEIYVMNADGSDQTRLTNNTGGDGEPFWSPDGTKLVFYGERGGDLEVFVINANGTGETQLTVNDAINDVQPDWSPDGTKIVFARGAAVANGGLDIWVMNANGSGEARLTSDPAVESTPAFSPDGTKIAFASDRNDVVPDIFVMNADGTDQTQITFERADDASPDWQVLRAGGPDSDNDGVRDADDNCPLTPNANQLDVCSLQNGDYVVGVGEPTGNGEQKGKIVRVRDGQQTDFCESQSWNKGVPPFFNIPREVVIDGQGRVVFLAYLGSNFDFVNQAGWGLWRCDAMGELPTLIAAFGANAAFDYPSPLGSRPVRQAGGLHLKRSAGVDLNTGAAAAHELYVFAVGDNCCGASPHDTLGYEPATGHFTSEDPPVPDAHVQFDMIYMSGPSGLGFPAGYTISVSENKLRAVLEPISLEFEIGEFHGGIAFKKTTDLEGLALDDVTHPNTPICPPGPNHPDFVPWETAYNSGGTINVMSGFNSLAAGDGLVIQSGNLGTGHPFLSQVSFDLLDLDPRNDVANSHHLPGCGHSQTLQHMPWHPFNSWGDANGVARGVTQMDPGGTVGTQQQEGRIVKVGSTTGTTGDVEILATGLNLPSGIEVYPGFRPPLGGVAIFIMIESPVDVLITGPDGRRIGAAAGAGPVNDYGEAGYDSQTNEPHIYGIYGPAAGDYTMSIKGTGTGPYRITTYGVDIGTLEVTQSSITGTASPGSEEQAAFGVDAQGHLVGTDTPPDAAPPTTTAAVSPEPNAAGWNKSDVSVILSSVDNEGGSGVKEIVYRIGAGAEQMVDGATAAIPLSAEGVDEVAYFARDEAGNAEEAKSLTVRIDKTAPTIGGSRAPEANAAGWNNSDVTVSFHCADSLSGVDSCSSATTLTSEGAGQSVMGSAIDKAGNSATITVTGINIDKTAPTITANVSPPANVRGWHRPPVTVGFECADALSGLASCAPAQTLTAPGVHEVVGEALDLAGNAADVALEVKVARLVTIDVKPGGEPNSVGCKATGGAVPVAILSSAAFDARTVDADSVRFGKTGGEAAETHRDRNGNAIRHVEDANRDGRLDLVLHFKLGDTGFSCADVPAGQKDVTLPARLTGFADAIGIDGEDTLRLVGG